MELFRSNRSSINETERAEKRVKRIPLAFFEDGDLIVCSFSSITFSQLDGSKTHGVQCTLTLTTPHVDSAFLHHHVECSLCINAQQTWLP